MVPTLNEPKVYIILVNFNRWQDTLECLESVFKLTYPNYSIIVVDNDSQNESYQHIRDWANGLITPSFNKDFYRKTNIDNISVPKPIPFLSFSWSDKANYLSTKVEEKLILIKSGHNLGFAGGNNLATTFALNQGDADYLWYLNNDTVVNKNALSSIMDFVFKEELANNVYGIIGTKLLFYHRPEVIQGIGGKYNKWFGLTSHVLENTTEKELSDLNALKAPIDYPIGASMVVKKEFLQEVGLMAEDYFLYFEELDWAQRAKRKGWSIISFLNCQIYHKESASIGNSLGQKSRMADFYNLRNRVLLSSKFFPHYLPLVYLGFIPVILNRLRRKQYDRIKMVFRILKNPYQHFCENK